MVQSNVSGIAVVNNEGTLTSSISVRDLRGLGISANEWTKLWMNVAKFKAECQKKFPQQTPDVSSITSNILRKNHDDV